MLSMVGIKLKKGPTSEEWKIVPQATNADSTSVTPKNIERASESEADKENTSPQVPEASVRSKKFEKDGDCKLVENQIVEELGVGSLFPSDNCRIQEREAVLDGESCATTTQELSEAEESRDEIGTGQEQLDLEDHFSSDDSIMDPDYEEPVVSQHSQCPTKSCTEKMKSRKRKAEPCEWKRNKTKLLRNSGQEYHTLNKNKPVSSRQMTQPCDGTCKLKCTAKFTEEDRKFLFTKFWNLANINKQRVFIATLMQEITPKYTYPILINFKRKRTNNNSFHLEKGEEKLRVCKKFFTSTFGISNRCIRRVISKRAEGDFEDKRGKHANQTRISHEIKNDVRAHIASIPQIESHYTRAHSEKKYIEGSKTITDLYRDYKKDCVARGKATATLTMYRNIFDYEFNLAFFIPKKDQCHTCVAYGNANEGEKKELEKLYEQHQNEKKLSRAEKLADKEKVSDKYQVLLLRLTSCSAMSSRRCF
ncbi:unnamed protein product [Acanthoscelides obtectus]|uniref:Uncharacterized protein n=1 Tax=Acanthoscelides obtectus TaxID=200917 RepID=A0A9P0PW22_ACAOB|nr:unnamed protein product [Acanthoscelides obtectus]CAK1643543.1 hypothetical protein AOBTE_LOCUS13571 [Acanthoscelides obtectus]